MHIRIRTVTRGMVLAGLAVAAPVWAVSLSSTQPAQPLPADGLMSAARAPETLAAGSATLIPVVAADLEARQVATIDAPATTGGTSAGKPVDDIQFVKQATESSRKEAHSARDALPRLKNPDLRRIAGMLVSDHSNAAEKLSRLAETKGWPVPGPAAQTPPASGTASSDFDSRWAAEMIAGHEHSVTMYRAQAEAGDDNDLRKYARDTLPTIESHLTQLRSAQK